MKIPDQKLPFLISGKFGDIVGRVINGQQFFSRRPGPRKTAPSLRELEIRRNMALATRFAKPIAPFIRQKYKTLNGRSGHNLLISHILRKAIEGQHPDQRINYRRVLLGNGQLPSPAHYRILSPAKGMLEFAWSLEIIKRKVARTDRIFTVVYCEAQHQFRYELSGSERRKRRFLMDVSCFSGEQVEVWFGFESASGRMVSPSVYAGPVHIL